MEKQIQPIEEKTLKQTMEELNARLEEEKNDKKDKNKKFSLPFGKKLSKKNIKDGYVIALVWGENNCVEIEKYPIVNNTIKVNDSFHSILSDNIGLYQGKFPFVHINKWNSETFSPKSDYEEARNKKTTTYGQKLVMARMLSDRLVSKVKMGGKAIIWILIAGVVAYVLFGGQLS